MLHVSHPYLVSLSFYTMAIPIICNYASFIKFAGFLIYLSPLSVKGGKSPTKILNNRGKWLLSSWK